MAYGHVIAADTVASVQRILMQDGELLIRRDVAEVVRRLTKARSAKTEFVIHAATAWSSAGWSHSTTVTPVPPSVEAATTAAPAGCPRQPSLSAPTTGAGSLSGSKPAQATRFSYSQHPSGSARKSIGT